MKQVCLTRKFLFSFFFYQKVKTISLYWVNSRRVGRGNDTQTPIQPAWDVAHSSTLWPMRVSKLVQNNAVFFLLLDHSTTASHTPTQKTQAETFMDEKSSCPEAQPKNASHCCVSRILVSRQRGVVSGELAEAGRPASRPRPVSALVRTLHRTRRESTTATRHKGTLTQVGHLQGRILGEETSDELKLFLLLLQENVHQELLLSFELLHDGFGDVGDHPRHHQAEEHHQILRIQEETNGYSVTLKKKKGFKKVPDG